MGVDGQRHVPAAFLPGKAGTHCTGSWVGPRVGLERCGKSRPPPGFDPRTVQPVVSLQTIKSNYLFSALLTKLKQSVQTPLAAKFQHFHAISCWG